MWSIIKKDKIIQNKNNNFIKINGAKNSSLPIISALLLVKGTIILKNIPFIKDVLEQFEILKQFNINVKYDKTNNIWIIDTLKFKKINKINYSKYKTRGSYYFMGSLFPYYGETIFELPGGCNIGIRDIDYHLDFFKKIDGEVCIIKNKIKIKSDVNKKSINYTLKYQSIGTTINAILSTVIGDNNIITLNNVALDPYIIDLCNFLRKMGALIRGDGTKTIIINSVNSLNSNNYEHEIIPDPIEAGSYIILSSLLLKKKLIKNVKIGPLILDHLGEFIVLINKIGINLINIKKNIYKVTIENYLNNFNIKTSPFPGIYTDLQPLLFLLASECVGKSKITDNVIFERFNYLNELKKIGYNYKLENNEVTINNITNKKYSNINLNCCDLRGGVSIFFGVLININNIKNVNINNINQILRGYDNILNKINNLNLPLNIFKNKILTNYSLKSLSTFYIGGYTKYFTIIRNKLDIIEIVKFIKKNKLKYYILGGGSNTIFTDSYYDGIIIKIEIKGIKYIKKYNNCVILNVNSGEIWDKLVEYTISHDLTGFEYMSLIPGTVGATPVQNVEAYRQEISENLVELKTYDIYLEKFIILKNKDCNFSYRNSIFKDNNRYIIISIKFKLIRNNGYPIRMDDEVMNFLKNKNIKNPTLRDIRNAVIEIRNSKLYNPNKFPNCGSFFKNVIVPNNIIEKLTNNYSDIVYYKLNNSNVKISTAYLINKIYRKGMRIGNLTISDKHILNLLNINKNATLQELIDFSQNTINKIKKIYNISIEIEPNIVL